LGTAPAGVASAKPDVHDFNTSEYSNLDLPGH